MIEIPVLLFGLSFVVGAVVGLEREYTHDEKSANTIKSEHGMGIRSYSLLSFIGGLTGYLTNMGNPLGWIAAGLAGLLIVSNYIISSIHTKDHGVTSEIGALATFFLGALLFVPGVSVSLVLALTFAVTFLLSRKQDIKSMAQSLHQFETNAFFMYGVIALVILPFLPNTWIKIGDLTLLIQLASAYHIPLERFTLVELINPYRLWLVVTLITGIDLLGYLLQKLLGGQKGWLIASLTGGFVSSTASTLALAQRSRKSASATPLVTAAVLANTASFVQMLILVLPLNAEFFTHASTFFAVLLLSGVVVSILLNMRSVGGSQPLSQSTSVFSIPSAFKFAVIFSVIRAGSQIARLLIGENGVILTSAIGAVAGMDAVVITIADLAGTSLSYQNALGALAIANTVNLGMKILYAKTNGSLSFFRQFAVALGTLIILSVTSLLISG